MAMLRTTYLVVRAAHLPLKARSEEAEAPNELPSKPRLARNPSFSGVIFDQVP